jgi:glycosyltransferase involved in cell wall biosynthesis
MKILFLSRWFPFPPDNGSKLRIFNLIKIAASQHEVDLISFTTEPITKERVEGLAPFCKKVQTVVYRDFKPTSFRSILGFFSLKPRFLLDTYSADFEGTINQFVKQKPYDLIVSSQIDLMPYMKLVKGVKKLYDEIELTMFSDARYNKDKAWQRLRSKLTWWKISHYIDRVFKQANGFSVVSDQEMEIVRTISKWSFRGEVIPNGIDMDSYQGDWGEPEPDTLIYAGALTYSANLEAMVYFISEIFPLVKQKRPAVKLFITGKVNDHLRAKLPKDPNVEFTGYLNDIRPQIARAWLSIIPLKTGGGTRLKILESLALGTPVVSTRKGAEGLVLISERDLIIRDVPVEFASAIISILEDRNLRMRLGNSGKKTVGSLYNWKIIGERLLLFMERIVERK